MILILSFSRSAESGFGFGGIWFNSTSDGTRWMCVCGTSNPWIARMIRLSGKMARSARDISCAFAKRWPDISEDRSTQWSISIFGIKSVWPGAFAKISRIAIQLSSSYTIWAGISRAMMRENRDGPDVIDSSSYKYNRKYTQKRRLSREGY